jgi:hypothetical protein
MLARRSVLVGLLGAALGGVSLFWIWTLGPLRSPEDALTDFLSAQDRAEDQLTDPLVLAGPRVRPLVLAAIQDRNMKLRRYAIAFLGCASYGPASPIFRRIAADPTEEEYFRTDALEAMWHVNRIEARALAADLVSAPGHLGMTARAVSADSAWTPCRTWKDAFLHRHD